MLAQEKFTIDAPQNIILESRSRMSISGVQDVESFDDTSVCLLTTRGVISVRGTGLHIERLSLESGEVNIEGTIDALEYLDEEPHGGFWSRLFR